MADDAEPILKLESLVSGYGKKPILDAVSLSVGRGEIVAVIGHNGAGKSTLLRAIFGIIPIWKGRVQYDGRVIEPRPHEMVRTGMGYVPQGNRVFQGLTVGENLQVAGVTLTDRHERSKSVDRAVSEYPALRDRLKQRADTLSGGEKQMLALAMSLVLSPRMILLDEPSLGLAPPLAAEALGRIRTMSRDHGISILIVEQRVREVMKIADRVYVVRAGAVSFSGCAVDLQDEQRLRSVFL